MTENNGYVLEYNASRQTTFVRGAGRLIESGPSACLKTDFALVRALDRKFYFVRPENESSEFEKLEFSLLTDVGMEAPYSYLVILTGYEQRLPKDSASMQLAPENGEFLWIERDSNTEAAG